MGHLGDGQVVLGRCHDLQPGPAGRGQCPDLVHSPGVGAVTGRHDGLFRYTVGQRKGLGAHGQRVYVTALDAAANAVMTGGHDELMSVALTARDANWTAFESPPRPFAAAAQIRSTAPETPCVVTPLAGGRFAVRFDTPVRAVTPGQAVALYQENRLVAGGIIE